MGKVIQHGSLGAKAEEERARVVEALRVIATRLEVIPHTKLL